VTILRLPGYVGEELWVIERKITRLPIGRKITCSSAPIQWCASSLVLQLIHSAKLNGIDPMFYLRTVLERIVEHPINRIGECCPGIFLSCSTQPLQNGVSPNSCPPK